MVNFPARRRLFPTAVSLCATLGSLMLGGLPRVCAQIPAGSSDPPSAIETAPSSLPWWTHRGHWSFGGQLGFALQNGIPNDISHIMLFVAQPQVGYVVHDFGRSPIRRFEVVGEGIVGNAVHPGGRLAGGGVLFRVHTTNRRSWVPFFDLGGGVQSTALYHRVPELTGSLQFSPQAGFGLQYFVRPQRAFVVEYRFLHMSNANLALPNLGFNASMLSIGFRWLRRPQALGTHVRARPRGNSLRGFLGWIAGAARSPFL